MTAQINTPHARPIPVVCNFWWEEAGPIGAFTYDGDSYPYPPLYPGDTRYLLQTTPIHIVITFDAIGQANSANPQVIPPPGVQILEYFWDFGDGTHDYGPVTKHVYRVADPNLSVTLTVVDSRNMRFSAAKPLNLISTHFGYLVPYKMRGLHVGGGGLASIRAAVDEVATSDLPISSFTGKKAGQGVLDKQITTDSVVPSGHKTNSTLAETVTQLDVATKKTKTKYTTAETANASDATTKKVVMALPTFTLRDSFKRGGEKPLSNSGKWSLITEFVDTGEIPFNPPLENWAPTGVVKVGTGTTVYNSGARWNVAEQINPAVTATIKTLPGPAMTLSLWGCLAAAAKSGYEVRINGGEEKLFVVKWVAGVATPLFEAPIVLKSGETDLYDGIAITVRSSTIRMWLRKTIGKAWSVVGEATDSTYTTGFVGHSASGTEGLQHGPRAYITNFESAEAR